MEDVEPVRELLLNKLFISSSFKLKPFLPRRPEEISKSSSELVALDLEVLGPGAVAAAFDETSSKTSILFMLFQVGELPL